MLAFIDKQIDEHEKHQKLIEIYNKVDGKSSAMLHKKMFKVCECVRARVTSSVLLLRDVLCPWGDEIIMCCSMRVVQYWRHMMLFMFCFIVYFCILFVEVRFLGE